MALEVVGSNPITHPKTYMGPQMGISIPEGALLNEYITTAQAAERARLTRSHVLRLLETGKLQGQRFGLDWMVYGPGLDTYAANRPRPGLKLGQKITRPRKVATV